MLRFFLRPKFSLRALFVLVMAIGLWLGWQWQIVNKRREVLERLHKDSKDERLRNGGGVMIEVTGDDRQLSWIRRALGDRALGKWNVREPISFSLIESVQREFPEAEFLLSGPGIVRIRWGPGAE